MIRVTSERSEDGTTLRVEGRLVGLWVQELASACEPFIEAGGPFRLDLSGVLFVSREGVALVRELAERGVQVTGSSHFVATLLQEGNHGAAGTHVR